MIAEDYCSYEVAKLLKEKGFDGACYSYYMTTKTLHTTFHSRVHVEEEPHFNSGGLNGMYDVNKSIIEDVCSAPTHQMAMKWLREVYNIIIEPESVWNGKKWEYLLFIVTPQNADSPYYEHNPYKSYEECVEAALKYCLENLI